MIGRRRSLMVLSGAALWPSLASAVDPHVYDIDVRRAPGCGCCRHWADHLTRTSMFRVAMADEADMAAYRRPLGVPDDLVSCHTGLVDGYVVEGHVPVREVLRLLAERPSNVRGLAVPGMPLGSPGMEVPSGQREAYEVIAFNRGGSRNVFARYPG